MLTSAQIKKLPKGDYPNWRLVKMFPKQQGHGKSAKMSFVKDERNPKGNRIERLINQFTGKVVMEKVRKTQSK